MSLIFDLGSLILCLGSLILCLVSWFFDLVAWFLVLVSNIFPSGKVTQTYRKKENGMKLINPFSFLRKIVLS